MFWASAFIQLLQIEKNLTKKNFIFLVRLLLYHHQNKCSHGWPECNICTCKVFSFHNLRSGGGEADGSLTSSVGLNVRCAFVTIRSAADDPQTLLTCSLQHDSISDRMRDKLDSTINALSTSFAFKQRRRTNIRKREDVDASPSSCRNFPFVHSAKRKLHTLFN